MVNSIDGAARRRLIVEAVWTLLARDGFDAASVRAVAAETGLATGSVRHFFSSQAELRVFALDALADRVGERILAATGEPDVRRRALAMIAEMLPLTSESRRELEIWFEFVHRSRREPALAAVVARQAGQIRQFLTDLVADLVAVGELPADTTIGVVALQLTALVDGFTFELLTAPGSVRPEEASVAIEALLFAGRPAAASTDRMPGTASTLEGRR